MNAVTLADIPLLWRAESLSSSRSTCVPTGFDRLDRALGGGWPQPSLIELLSDDYGIGELRLLLELMRPHRALSSASRQVVLWLSPPYELQAVALSQYGLSPTSHWVCATSRPADLQWAMAQALRSGACLAVIGWAPELKPAAARMLKLAAMSGRSVGVLFRPGRFMRTASPATLRLSLRPASGALEVTVLKLQGRRPCTVLIDPADVERPNSTED